eukprot:6205964-Amphidinium_carterae.1
MVYSRLRKRRFGRVSLGQAALKDVVDIEADITFAQTLRNYFVGELATRYSMQPQSISEPQHALKPQDRFCQTQHSSYHFIAPKPKEVFLLFGGFGDLLHLLQLLKFTSTMQQQRLLYLHRFV